MKFAHILLKNTSRFNIPKQVDRFSKFSPSPLSMKQFIDFGKLFSQHYNKSSRLRPANNNRRVRARCFFFFFFFLPCTMRNRSERDIRYTVFIWSAAQSRVYIYIYIYIQFKKNFFLTILLLFHALKCTFFILELSSVFALSLSLSRT